jgi:hypothetical protein
MADSTTVFAAKDESFSATVNRLQKSLGAFEGNLSKFNERAANIGKGFANLAAKVAAIGVAFLGVRAVAQSFMSAIDMGGKLNDLSARTGETAGNLAILQRAFQNAGAGADAVGPTINRLQRAIVAAGEGSKEQAETFAKLGVNLDKLKSQTPIEQLQTVAQALQGVNSDSERTAIAMSLLGRSGGELIPLFRAMGVELETARNQLGSTPAILNETAQTLDTIGDNFGAIGEKGTEFMLGLMKDLAPAIADVTTRLANIDAAGFGAKLSEYAQRTVEWIAETFKLKDAINQIEVAIKGITSGNFGEGLKLMFMTARDTALNAINNIVAAAGAALETVGSALKKLFSPGSTTMAFIEGSFQMLGAKIASGVFDSLASVLEKLPFMDAAASAVREAQKEAEQAVKDISNIMYYEADNLKKEWGSIMAEMPQEFARSYAANMQQPLFEMTDRAAETADQMERVAAATRAAAFDAKAFGQAMRDAQVDRLAGDYADSPFPKNTRGGGTKTPPIINSSARIDDELNNARALYGPRGGGSSSPTLTQDQTVAEMRADAARERRTGRVGEFMDRGAFRSAAQAMEAGARAANRISENQRERDVMSDLFGAKNLGDSLRNFERDARLAGMTPDEALSRMGIDREVGEDRRDALDRLVKDLSKTPEERAREEEEMRQKHAPRGGGGDTEQGIINQIHSLLQKHMPSIDEKLPQHALVPG